MLNPRIRAALVVLAASAGLGACTSLGPYGGVGVGVGSQYGYGGYGYDPYYSPYGYNSGYGYNPYGWYNGYYYPGSGYWVYDPDGHHHPITGEQRSYWSNVIAKARAARGGEAKAAAAQENWSGFSKQGRVPAPIATSRTLRERALEQRAQRAQVSAEQQQIRAERREERQQEIQTRSEARPARRRPRN